MFVPSFKNNIKHLDFRMTTYTLVRSLNDERRKTMCTKILDVCYLRKRYVRNVIKQHRKTKQTVSCFTRKLHLRHLFVKRK